MEEGAEGCGEDEGVFEGHAGAGGLVRAACVGDVAEEAEEGGVVRGRCGVVEDGPAGWGGVLGLC